MEPSKQSNPAKTEKQQKPSIKIATELPLSEKDEVKLAEQKTNKAANKKP